MLVPTYFIVGIWGGVDRTKAVLKYVLMTMVGSLLMLVAIISLWSMGGSTSFGFDHLSTIQLSSTAQLWMFGAFFLAFAVKSGLVPFHTWMPDAQQTAPTLGAVTLGIKVGMYAMLRFAIPLFPAAATNPTVQKSIVGAVRRHNHLRCLGRNGTDGFQAPRLVQFDQPPWFHHVGLFRTHAAELAGSCVDYREPRRFHQPSIPARQAFCRIVAAPAPCRRLADSHASCRCLASC